MSPPSDAVMHGSHPALLAGPLRDEDSDSKLLVDGETGRYVSPFAIASEALISLQHSIIGPQRREQAPMGLYTPPVSAGPLLAPPAGAAPPEAGSTLSLFGVSLSDLSVSAVPAGAISHLQPLLSHEALDASGATLPSLDALLAAAPASHPFAQAVPSTTPAGQVQPSTAAAEHNRGTGSSSSSSWPWPAASAASASWLQPATGAQQQLHGTAPRSAQAAARHLLPPPSRSFATVSTEAPQPASQPHMAAAAVQQLPMQPPLPVHRPPLAAQQHTQPLQQQPYQMQQGQQHYSMKPLRPLSPAAVSSGPQHFTQSAQLPPTGAAAQPLALQQLRAAGTHYPLLQHSPPLDQGGSPADAPQSPPAQHPSPASPTQLQQQQQQRAAPADEPQVLARYDRHISCRTYLKRLNVTAPMAETLLPRIVLTPDDPGYRAANAPAQRPADKPKYQALYRRPVQLVDASSGRVFPAVYDASSCGGQRHLRFTGGWKQFVQAAQLLVGDTVVFERRVGEGEWTLFLHVIRSNRAAAAAGAGGRRRARDSTTDDDSDGSPRRGRKRGRR